MKQRNVSTIRIKVLFCEREKKVSIAIPFGWLFLHDNGHGDDEKLAENCSQLILCLIAIWGNKTVARESSLSENVQMCFLIDNH